MKGARNHPLWLRHRLPRNARIQVEAEAKSDDGDIKLEAWGDGHAAATGPSYTDATITRKSKLRQELERELWGDSPPQGDFLRAHMHALRTAIDKNFPVKLLHTIHGTGYRLSAEPVRS